MQDLKENRPQPAIRDRGIRELQKKAERLEKLEITKIAVEDLRPNSYNPNRQSEKDFDLLCRSMREDGFTQPIIAIADSKVIVDGEHRWRAAMKLGYKEVPVVLVEMTSEQMRIATLRHNRARGSEDVQLSAEVMKDLIELGAVEWARDSLMMSQKDIDRLVNDLPITEIAAAEEFSEAWISARSEEGLTQTEALEIGGSGKLFASSKRTVDFVKAQSSLADGVENMEEKRKIIQSMNDNMLRIAVSFTDEEAKLVKLVLGAHPAVELLRLCKEALGMEDK